MVETTEKIFPEHGRYSKDAPSALISVQVNGGSLTIVHLMDDNTEIAIENGVISSDDTFKLDVGGGRFKATPAGGCEYEWVA